MSYRIILILVTLVFSNYISFCQSKPPLFVEVIKDDSVMLFFNKEYHLTEKKCADYTRFVKIDDNGNYNGPFEDFNNENRLLGKGIYVNGKKEGYFEIYYPNGKIKCKGNYLNNRPIGEWDFFYENEFPERTLKFTETDTMLIRFFDNKGKLKVTDGQGEFIGYVAGLTKPSTVLMAHGKIIGGKPNGKWTSSYSNSQTFCKEEFDRVKLIRGIFPNAKFEKDYYDKSFINTFFLENYTYLLELFVYDNCPDKTIINKYKSFDTQIFSSDLKSKIEDVIKNDFRNGKTEDYSEGDHYLTIQFEINKEGIAENFSITTYWGKQFISPISNSIRMHTRFQQYPKIMFFHLKMHFNAGFIYNYYFHFSKDITFD